MHFQYQPIREQNSQNNQSYYQQQGQQAQVQMQQFGNYPYNSSQQLMNQYNPQREPINPMYGHNINNHAQQDQLLTNYPLQAQPIIGFPAQGVNYPQDGNQSFNNPNMNINYRQNTGFIPIRNPLLILAQCQGIYIKQKLEKLQVLTGWQCENSYKVFQADANGTQTGNLPLFKCKEKSQLLQRFFMNGDSRAFNMDITFEDSILNTGQAISTPFLALERPFKFTFFSYNRPKLNVSYIDNGSKIIFGFIKNPFQCCELGCEVYDADSQLIYVIKGSCCQLGYICKGLPCNACQEYEFIVRNTRGEIVSRLLKKSAGFIKSALSDCDDFCIGFPENCSPQQKALLMSAAVFLDYMYFENKKNSKND